MTKKIKVWKDPDFQLGLGLGIVSLAVIYYSLIMPSAERAGAFKANSYPLLLAVPLLLIAAWTVFGSVISRTEREEPFVVMDREALVTFLGALVYIPLTKCLGFYLSNTLYVSFLLYLYGERTIWKYIVFSVTLSVSVGAVFNYFFGVSLPMFWGGF